MDVAADRVAARGIGAILTVLQRASAAAEARAVRRRKE
jgi:hypothetical protein